MEEKVDAVVFATGFTSGLPFPTDALPREGEDRLLLYKMMVPAANPNVAFLGFVDANASLLQAFEMQARYMALVFSGKLKLPSREAMEADITATQRKIKSSFVPTPRHSLMIDRIAYVEDLAKAIGAKPNYLKLLVKDPKLYWTLMTSPVLHYQYRLEGPHSWSGARDAILGFKDRLQAPLAHRNNGEKSRSATGRLTTAANMTALLAVAGISVCVGCGSPRNVPGTLAFAFDKVAARLLAFASRLGLSFATAS